MSFQLADYLRHHRYNCIAIRVFNFHNFLNQKNLLNPLNLLNLLNPLNLFYGYVFNVYPVFYLSTFSHYMLAG